MLEVNRGDILAGSWGYSMTLWTFMEVEAVTDKTVVLRELENERLGGPQWREQVRPILGSTSRSRPTPFRVKRPDNKDYIWDSKYKSLLRPYVEGCEYFENHLD